MPGTRALRATRALWITLVLALAGPPVGVAAGHRLAGPDRPPGLLGGAPEPAPVYRPPVAAPLVDGFRLPSGPYGSGNRGLEYATEPGTPVGAIGPGRVVFAGPVAGVRAVTVLHPDGLRSSYSPLAEVRVDVGAAVTAGQAVGRSGPRLHLGVRSGAAYLDPAALFATGLRPHLVPVHSPAGRIPARGPAP